MSKDQRLMALGGGMVVLAVAIGFFTIRRPANNANFPDGVWWICENPNCKNEFVLTTRQLSDYYKDHYGEALRCPKCGQATVVRAQKCHHCGFVFPAEGARTCPKCGAKIESQ